MCLCRCRRVTLNRMFRQEIGDFLGSVLTRRSARLVSEGSARVGSIASGCPTGENEAKRKENVVHLIAHCSLHAERRESQWQRQIIEPSVFDVDGNDSAETRLFSSQRLTRSTSNSRTPNPLSSVTPWLGSTRCRGKDRIGPARWFFSFDH